jgi:hypothetical protein
MPASADGGEHRKRDSTPSDGSRGRVRAGRAEVLGLRESRRGLIPIVELGRYRRFREEAIERMVEQLEHGTSGRAAREAR